MPYPIPPDLSQLVHQHMASGKYTCEDDLLRSALRALTEEEEILPLFSKRFMNGRQGMRGFHWMRHARRSGPGSHS